MAWIVKELQEGKAKNERKILDTNEQISNLEKRLEKQDSTNRSTFEQINKVKDELTQTTAHLTES